MIIYPAIDLLEGRVVRLHKGEFGAVTDYGDDPARVAAGFAAAGAEWVHVVDLAGARDGARRQTDLVAAICATGLRVQTGGGVRTTADIDQLLAAGAERVIIGSLAITDPDRVCGWIDRYGAQAVTLALDVREQDGLWRPAVKGWTETVDTTLHAVMDRYHASGLRHALVTDIGRDGDLGGPNLALYRELTARYPAINWQASGGVSSLADLDAVRLTGAAGAITGKALYEGRFSLQEALACSHDA